MSATLEMDPVERLTAGAIGEPGERTFYVQAFGGATQLAFTAEKEQVRLLAEAAQQLLAQLPPPVDEGIAPATDDLELIEPVIPEWRVGQMTLEYEEARDRIAILLTELVPEGAEEAVPATARLVATRAQVDAMAERALDVVAAGRPRCQFCGYPLPTDGSEHPCPAQNGHGRPPL